MDERVRVVCGPEGAQTLLLLFNLFMKFILLVS